MTQIDSPRRVAIITGSRAEFGLLQPVMQAVRERAGLELLIIAAGSHLTQAGLTYRDVKEFAKELGTGVADAVPMQIDGKTGRSADAEALGAGVSKFTRVFMRQAPDWVVVLGDRIEAFAAAAAASVGGWALAHIHGGDRAEGVADEAMRHAITKLAHLHLAATEESARRIKRMGERAEAVHVVGSPAIDGLAGVPEVTDDELARAGWKGAGPEAVFLMHPVGRAAEEEQRAATTALRSLAGRRVMALMPNLDPGRDGIVNAIEEAARANKDSVGVMTHLPRRQFVGLLKRLARAGGVLVGNSSAGLIEAAALRVRVVDIGARQAGREQGHNVVHAEREDGPAVTAALAAAGSLNLSDSGHPYGDGRAGVRIAEVLAAVDPHDVGLLRKRCAY